MEVVLEYAHKGFLISTDKNLLEIDVVHEFLSKKSYWAKGRSISTVEASIRNSLCYGVYTQGRQVGFARVVTDFATVAWILDVFILESERGKGYGKQLVQDMMAHPGFTSLRRILLATQDAHDLYRRYGGFELIDHPDRWMEVSHT